MILHARSVDRLFKGDHICEHFWDSPTVEKLQIIVDGYRFLQRHLFSDLTNTQVWVFNCAYTADISWSLGPAHANKSCCFFFFSPLHSDPV